MTALIFLDDYLKQPDFRVALRALAHDFRTEAQLPLTTTGKLQKLRLRELLPP